MKKTLLTLAGLMLATAASADANDPLVYQRHSTDCCDIKYDLPQPANNAHGIFIFNSTSKLIEVPAFGAGFTLSGATLDVTPAFSSVTGLPSTLAGYGISDAYPLTGNPSGFVTSSALSSYLTISSAASTYATTSALTAGLATKYTTPTGTTAQYIRGDGSIATLPAAPAAFNFSQPSARTLVVSTDYQAADPSKAAIVTPTYACTNATQVLVSSACTVQVRMGTGSLTCSTGTVLYTQSLTVSLGVLLTQASSNPVSINLPIGAHFIMCATAGTFTITTVEQSAG